MAAPGAPTSVVATLSGRDVVVTWVAPASDGGSALTRYDVQPLPSGTLLTTTPPTVTKTVTGLSAGAHTVEVRAVNADGQSAYVESNSVEVPVPFSTLWDANTEEWFRRNPSYHLVKDEARDAYSAGISAGFVDTILADVSQAASGAAAGGNHVTIRGAGFTGATGVKFGTADATGFALYSKNEIRCITPAHAAGAVDVTVVMPGTDIVLTGGYTYV